MESEFRSKVIETFWLFWTFILIGFDNGILGPCLPDLQTLVQASLRQMSFIFFVQGTGGLAGFALGLLLEKHFDRTLLLALYVIAGSAVNIALPLVPNFFYVLGMFLLQGVTKGLADFEAMSVCNILWKGNKALPFQFIVAGAGISTFISPFIAQPFISDNPSTLQLQQSSVEGCPLSPDSPQNSSALGVDAETKSLHPPPGLRSASHSQNISASDMEMMFDASGSDVRIPFVIVGIVTLPAGVAFLYYYFTRREYSEQSVSVVEDSAGECASAPDLTTGLLTGKRVAQKEEIAFKVILLFLHIPVFGLLLTFADLLTSIGMTSPYCMTPAEASYFVIVLWGAAALGRAVNGLMAICVPMFHLLLFGAIALVGCGLGLYLGTGPTGTALALWFGTAGVGLFLTPSMPGYLAWSAEYVPVTSAFLSLCLCLSGVGELLLPFLGGQLMATYGKDALMLFALITMVTMPVLFLIAFVLGRRIRKS